MEHHEEERSIWARLAVSAVLLLAGLFVPMGETVKLCVLLLSLLTAGYDVMLGAVRGILHGEFLDEKFLMTLASIGAFVLGEYAEGVAVLLLFQVGEAFQDAAVDKSRDSIAKLIDIRPDTARVIRNHEECVVSPDAVQVGETILVQPGERIPLDGVVIAGASALNTVALTGESVPRKVQEGDTVLSGCVNLNGLLRMRVTNDAQNSAVTRILELVEHASENKSRADQFLTRFCRFYTPVVVGLALLVVLVPGIITGDWALWLHRSLSFLVISCPCALVISVPLTYFSGIGSASRRGILVKGANSLESLSKIAIAAFDKTGTLTKGTFEVTAVHAQNMEDTLLLQYAAAAEKYSTHPIAESLRAAAQPLRDFSVADVREIAGCGLVARVEGHEVAVGNAKLMETIGLSVPDCSTVHVAIDHVYAGDITIADAVKEGAAEAVADLRSLGVRSCVMLSGDVKAVAEDVGRAVDLDAVYAELLPNGKVAQVEQLLSQCAKGEQLVFIGEGINDAPVLARADVGVAMGALGSDAAMEAADVILMDDDPRKLASAIRIARKTQRIVWQNIIFSLAVKFLIMLLSVLGVSNLWFAVFADVGVCFLAILNALRNV